MANYQQRVAENIIRAREQAGYDREPFALRAGISVKQLRRIEQGKSSPRLGTIRKIAETAGVKITDIRPDLDEEEEGVREQLDRIENALKELLGRITLTPSEPGGVPESLPPGPDRPPEPPDEDERATG
jgi:transcriptional regulator with XRE-family HTH domain